ncbi:hypothetical protein DL769_001443 [Monosporascus sp. CRB-8-3]|nr:hypothetical protein DL769_001443 [Monosporascus sp. CRB-8-3]
MSQNSGRPAFRGKPPKEPLLSTCREPRVAVLENGIFPFKIKSNSASTFETATWVIIDGLKPAKNLAVEWSAVMLGRGLGEQEEKDSIEDGAWNSCGTGLISKARGAFEHDESRDIEVEGGFLHRTPLVRSHFTLDMRVNDVGGLGAEAYYGWSLQHHCDTGL